MNGIEGGRRTGIGPSCPLLTREQSSGVLSSAFRREFLNTVDVPVLSGCPKCVNIAHWRLAEEPLVLTIELTGALIPNLEGCACGIEFLREHLLARSVKPKLLLKLQRAHGCEA